MSTTINALRSANVALSYEGVGLFNDVDIIENGISLVIGMETSVELDYQEVSLVIVTYNAWLLRSSGWMAEAPHSGAEGARFESRNDLVKENFPINKLIALQMLSITQHVCNHNWVCSFACWDLSGQAAGGKFDLSVIQLNLQTHILVQREMPVLFGTIDQTQSYWGRFFPQWLFTSCHDGAEDRTCDPLIGVRELSHSAFPTCIDQSLCIALISSIDAHCRFWPRTLWSFLRKTRKLHMVRTFQGKILTIGKNMRARESFSLLY